MTRLGFPLFAAMLLLPAMPRPAQALGSGPAALCQAATAAAELSTGVPNQLLGAISRVETGRYDPDAGGTRAWPWTINAQGKGPLLRIQRRKRSRLPARSRPRAFHRSMSAACRST